MVFSMLPLWIWVTWDVRWWGNAREIRAQPGFHRRCALRASSIAHMNQGKWRSIWIKSRWRKQGNGWYAWFCRDELQAWNSFLQIWLQIRFASGSCVQLLICYTIRDLLSILQKPRKSYRALRWLLWRPVYKATCTTGLCPWLFIPWNLLDPYLLSSSLVILRSEFPSQLRVFHYEVYNSPDHFIPWFFHGPFPLNHRIRTAGDHDDGVETQAKALGSIGRGNILDISFALEQPGVFLWGGWC